jgi:hypothetical protein
MRLLLNCPFSYHSVPLLNTLFTIWLKGFLLFCKGIYTPKCGRDSVVGIETERSGDRILVGGVSVLVLTGPGAHPASYNMGTGSSPWVKRPGRGVNNSPSSTAEVKERVGLYVYSHSGPSWRILGWNLLSQVMWNPLWSSCPLVNSVHP